MPEDQSDKYYMFCFCKGTFRDKNVQEMDQFWKDYCKKDFRPWHDELVKAAKGKNDQAMLIYLQQNKIYNDICDELSNTWEYPTALQLSQRKQKLRGVLTVAKANLNTKYGSRWALLLMRANMLLNNHQENITFFTNTAKKYPNDCYKDLMRNIYARDLLLTGKKQQAWNIYAEQNDQESLLWSVRKFTNLAGIKSLCNENPNAPVINYLVQTYVNRIQSLVDEKENGYATYLDYTNVIWGKAYAQVSSNQNQEFKGFVDYAKQMAQGGKTEVPCMWMSAAALVNYFMHDNQQAKLCIDKAMDMKGTQAMKDNARRIRLLIEPTVADVKSNQFKSFLANELRWLDSTIKDDDVSDISLARERIVKHAVASEYARRNDKTIELGLHAVADYNESLKWDDYYKGRYNYSSESFHVMKNMTAQEVQQYFNTLENNAGDPVVAYLSSKLSKRYNENFKNDLIGTKLIAENKLAEALQYLKKVDMNYLESQAIAFYAANRDYKTPAWEGYQSIDASMYDDEGELAKVSLNKNVKVEFCKDVIDMQNRYTAADADVRKQIAYQLATAYFQASYKGQCWFITHYGQSCMDEQNPKEADFPKIAHKYLDEAATSADSRLKSEALLGLVGIAPDLWATEEYDDNYNLYWKINRNSVQYSALNKLDSHIKSTNSAPEYVSNCDVLLTFRKHR